MHHTKRQAALPGYDTADMVAESIAFLRKHEPPEGFFVGFSGGKDSIVTLTLCEMAGVKYQAFFSCTRIDPPEIYPFIRRTYPQVQWLFPKKSFWSLIQQKGPPFRMRRWCCDSLKKEPAKDIPLHVRVMGIRAEESATRAKRGRINVYKGNTILAPIFCWKEWQVWDFIDTHGLAYPSLYDEGNGRLGCVVCPFTFHGDKAETNMQAYPQIWKAFEHAVKRWWLHKREIGCHPDYAEQSWNEFWQKYIRGEHII